MKTPPKQNKLNFSKKTVMRLTNIFRNQINAGFAVPTTSIHPTITGCSDNCVPITGARNSCESCVSEPQCKTTITC
jgi:hypothetical protein